MGSSTFDNELGPLGLLVVVFTDGKVKAGG